MAYDPSSPSPSRPGRPDEAHPPDGEILSADRLESLREALDQLPDELRRCFLLRYGRGYGEGAIAILMKLPIDRVRACLSEARRRLGVEGSGEIS